MGTSLTSRAPWSIRRRLALWLALGLLLVFGAAGALTASALCSRVTEEFDDGLIARARALQALTEQESGRIEFDYRPGALPEFERAEAPEYFQFWLEDGQVLLRSSRMPEGVDLPLAEGFRPTPRLSDAALPDGRAGRVVQISFQPNFATEDGDDEDVLSDPKADLSAQTPGVTLVVARGRASLDALIARMRWIVYGIGGAAALLAVLLVWRALAAGFRPIEQIARQVETLGTGAWQDRIESVDAPVEVAPVAERMNALLGRLQELYERERRFTGNVAHELRTPIAELRSLASVAGRWPDDPVAMQQFFGDVGSIAGRMDGMVADLLLLARCQAGVEAVHPAPIALADAVDTAWQASLTRAARAGTLLQRDISEGLTIQSDPGKFAILLGNLLGNAVSHGLPGQPIGCTARTKAGQFRLEITNACEPLSPEELAHLTEPFWQRDPARTSAEHSGLGLTLVGALASLLALDVRFDQPQSGQFRVVVEGKALTTPSAVELEPILT